MTRLITLLLAAAFAAGPAYADQATVAVELPAAVAVAPVSGRAAVVNEVVADFFIKKNQGGSFDEIMIAGCPVGEAPICAQWETRTTPECRNWVRDGEGNLLCTEWTSYDTQTCVKWACGGDH